MLALLVSVGVSAGALVADLTATPTHDVPAVKGLDVDAAREKLAANKWKIVEQRTRKDDTDPGEVLSVTPVAGTSLREGEQVTLLVSDGPTMADVPTDLAGQPVADATRALEARGFEVSTTEQYHEDVDADRVISLAEGTKMRQPKGETVGLIVSKGPEPRTIPDDLAGQTKADAIAELKALKLTPEDEGPARREHREGHRDRQRAGRRRHRGAGRRGGPRGLARSAARQGPRHQRGRLARGSDRHPAGPRTASG